jgi:hypothetical protein
MVWLLRGPLVLDPEGMAKARRFAPEADIERPIVNAWKNDLQQLTRSWVITSL